MFLERNLVVFSLTVGTNLAAPTTTCLNIVTVSGKGEEMDGKYILKEEVAKKRNEVCIDGCVYLKEMTEDEYCFKSVDISESAFVQCEVREFLSFL